MHAYLQHPMATKHTKEKLLLIYFSNSEKCFNLFQQNHDAGNAHLNFISNSLQLISNRLWSPCWMHADKDADKDADSDGCS